MFYRLTVKLPFMSPTKKYDVEEEEEELPWECVYWFLFFCVVGVCTSIGFTVALVVLNLSVQLWFVYGSFWICSAIMFIGIVVCFENFFLKKNG